MKIRNGFVSNSSSSSFCIFGKTLYNPEEISLTLRAADRRVIAIGDYLNDGRDIIEVDEKILKFVIENNIFRSFKFIHPYKEIMSETVDSDDRKIKNDLPEVFEVFSGDVDYHCSETIADIADRYLEAEV